MGPNRMLLVVEALVGCSLLVGSMVALKARRAAEISVAPRVVIEEGVRSYQQRIDATTGLLIGDRLEADGI